MFHGVPVIGPANFPPLFFLLFEGSEFEQILNCCSEAFENQQSLFHIQLVDDICLPPSAVAKIKKGTSPFGFQEAVEVLLLNIVAYSLDSSKPAFYFQSDKLAGFLCSFTLSRNWILFTQNTN